MGKTLASLSNITGILGILLCFVAGLCRFIGVFYVVGYEALTLFDVGVGLMVFSTLLKMEQLLRSR